MVDFASVLMVVVFVLVVGGVVWAIGGSDDVFDRSPILLFSMAKRLGVDLEDFSRAKFGRLMADSVRICLTCRHKGICRDALASSQAVPFGTFCPNAERLQMAQRMMAA